MPTLCPSGFADAGACVAPALVGAGWGWPKLLRMALDQRRRLGRNYAGERETGGRKERAEVRFGTFTTNLAPLEPTASMPLELSPGEAVLLLSPDQDDALAQSAGDLLHQVY